MNNLKSLTILSALAMTTFSCNQAKDRVQAKKTESPSVFVQEEKAVVNSHNLSLKKSEEGRYLVTAASQNLKKISFANDPIKSTCKNISKLQHEMKALVEEKEKVVALSIEDIAYEGAVDELATAIEEKSVELDALKAKTFSAKEEIDKKAFLSQLETLKQENPDLNFEAVQPTKMTVSISNSPADSVKQSISAEAAIKSGSFQDLSTDDVKLSLDLSYELLCQARALDSNVREASEKPKIVLSFE